MLRKWRVIVLCILLVTALFGSNVSAANIITAKYDDFSDLSQFTLNGNTVRDGVLVGGQKVLRLTPARETQSGSAFLSDRVSLANKRSFSTYFSFQMSNWGGIAPADGLVFVIQTKANNVGGNGSGLGYAGITPSLGIEFDTFDNPEYDYPYSFHHVGINLNGNPDSVLQAYTPNLLNTIWHVWVDYNGNTQKLEVRMSINKNRPTNAILTYDNLNLQQVLNMDEVYVGFTAATGAGWETHDIRSFYFNNDYAPIDVNQVYEEAPTEVVVSTDIVSGSKWQERTITAVVKDRKNHVVPNHLVTFSTSKGSITQTALTDANGVATATLTSNELGTAKVKAMAVGGAYGEVDVNFTNMIPVANDVVVQAVEDTGAVVGELSVTDMDQDPFAYKIVSGPSKGSVQLNGNQFTYTPEANQYGDATFSYKVNDGTVDSNTANVTVSILPVNDAPSFVKGEDITVNQSVAGKEVTLADWAHSISAGPENESDQSVEFIVSNDQNSLFDVQPRIDSAGKLTFTPKDHVSGTANVSVQLKDNGGTANGGVDVSQVENFKIQVDTKAPTVKLSTDQNTLWSPNHKMVLINVKVDTTDDDIASIILTNITSNEPDFDPSFVDDDVAKDIETNVIGTNATSFHLRSERSGKGNGRIYTITYTVTDKVGNTTIASTEVFVPHDKGAGGKKK